MLGDLLSADHAGAVRGDVAHRLLTNLELTSRQGSTSGRTRERVAARSIAVEPTAEITAMTLVAPATVVAQTSEERAKETP